MYVEYGGDGYGLVHLGKLAGDGLPTYGVQEGAIEDHPLVALLGVGARELGELRARDDFHEVAELLVGLALEVVGHVVLCGQCLDQRVDVIEALRDLGHHRFLDFELLLPVLHVLLQRDLERVCFIELLRFQHYLRGLLVRREVVNHLDVRNLRNLQLLGSVPVLFLRHRDVLAVV